MIVHLNVEFSSPNIEKHAPLVSDASRPTTDDVRAQSASGDVPLDKQIHGAKPRSRSPASRFSAGLAFPVPLR